jgi:hypothetical protein
MWHRHLVDGLEAKIIGRMPMPRSSEEPLGRKQGLRLADPRDAMLPAFVTAQDLDFDPEKIDGNIRFREARKTHGILFSGHDHFEIAADASIDKAI